MKQWKVVTVIKVYANLVYRGIKTLDQVPASLRMAVELEVEKIRQANS
jgi:hypothetical protein